MNVALRSEPLNILSICTGGAGLDLGLELAVPSARTVCMVEREAFAVAQLVSAMETGLLAPAPIWSDARTFNGREWRGAVDGLIGGIPCQPHSLAGRKQGSLDHRDLWSDARRIIVQSRCRFVLIENVSGMLSAGDDEIAGAERVWRDLRKLGFSVEIGLFTAAEVGASHERERVFILGVADAGHAGLQGSKWGEPYDEWVRATAPRSVAELRGTPLVHAERAEWGPNVVAGYEPDRQDGGRDKAASRTGEPSELVDDTSIARGRSVSVQPGRQDEADPDADGTGARSGCLHLGQHLADADCDEPSAFRRDAGEVPSGSEGEGRAEHGSTVSGGRGIPTFPPGPGDINGWRAVLERAPEFEPAVRRVADGLASRLDIARVDRLRMLGNGVVPLQAAYAVRTLATRLAARGSTGATRLVRMMESAE